MRAMVTGAGGFLGRALVSELLDHNISVCPIPRARFDLRRREDAYEALLSSGEVDVVYHLAATAGGIGANADEPARFFYDNITMGVNVIDAVYRASWHPKLVLVGTVCSYPKFCEVPFKEDDLWKGYPEETNAPYGIAKRALYEMARAYRQQYRCNIVTVLPANLYGPEDNFDLETSHVIPALIRKFVEAKAKGEDHVTLWGDGHPTREFLFVDDAARGLYFAARDYDGGEPINLGNGNEVGIAELAYVIRRIIGFSGDIHWDLERPNGQPRRALDLTRQRDKLPSFHAIVGLDEGLRRTIAWYMGNQDWKRK